MWSLRAEAEAAALAALIFLSEASSEERTERERECARERGEKVSFFSFPSTPKKEIGKKKTSPHLSAAVDTNVEKFPL